MKKIKDERLILQNLKNIRIAYIVQTLGILIILISELIQHGPEGVVNNPLWLVLLLSGVVINFLNMRISVDLEKDSKNPKKSLWLSIVAILAVAILVSILVQKSASFNIADALIFGAIIIIFGLIPSLYIYKLRVEKQKDTEE